MESVCLVRYVCLASTDPEDCCLSPGRGGTCSPNHRAMSATPFFGLVMIMVAARTQSVIHDRLSGKVAPVTCLSVPRVPPSCSGLLTQPHHLLRLGRPWTGGSSSCEVRCLSWSSRSDVSDSATLRLVDLTSGPSLVRPSQEFCPFSALDSAEAVHREVLAGGQKEFR